MNYNKKNEYAGRQEQEGVGNNRKNVVGIGKSQVGEPKESSSG